ncbi:MAG: aminotransferase class V-fold PLP-dependent enzyme, partial [Chthoniobacteraceae bacterium]
ELAAVDLLSFSAHKFHGPKGVGALFVRNTNSIAPLFHGGGQQLGLRPGTENPAGLVGMSAALVALTSAEGLFGPVQKLRDQIQERILSLHSGSFALGSAVQRLPNTLNICIPGIPGGDLVDHMATAGIAISTGSACAHGANKPSHVVLAMGLSYPQADCCVRISLSVETTQQEADELLDSLAAQITSNVTI